MSIFTRDMIHQGYGPMPSQIDEVLASLKNESAIDTEAVDYKDGELVRFELKNPKKLDA